MKKTPKYFINRVVEQIPAEVAELCGYAVGQPIDRYVEEIIIDRFQNANVSEIRANVFKNHFQKTKRRWNQGLQKSVQEAEGAKTGGELLSEIRLASQYLNLYGSKKFQIAYGAEDLRQLSENRLSEVKAWSEDTSALLCAYPYMKEKTTLQIKKALDTDITLLVANTLISHFAGDLNKIIVEMPDVLMEAVYADGKGRLPISKEVTVIEGTSYYVNDYTPDSGYSLNTLIKQELIDADPENAKKYLRLLDDMDAKIFRYVMSQRNLDFHERQTIYVNVGEMVRSLCASDSSDSYQYLEARLIKLANLRFTLYNKNKEVSVFGIFDELETLINTNGERSVSIKVSDKIHEQYMKYQVTRMYHDKLQSFESSIASILVFAFQKDRFSCYMKNASYQTVYSYSFFLHKLRFRKRNKPQNLQLIEECLSELVKHHITINHFERKGDSFYVEFLPVLHYEIEDLLNAKETPKLGPAVEQLTLL